MSARDYWLMSGCYLGLAVLNFIGGLAVALLAIGYSAVWFIKLPFKLLASGWRAVRG